MSCGPAGAEAVLDAPVLDLLLEQPAPAATTMATPATPTTIPRFTTALLQVADRHVSSWPRQHKRTLPPLWSQAQEARVRVPDRGNCKQSIRGATALRSVISEF